VTTGLTSTHPLGQASSQRSTEFELNNVQSPQTSPHLAELLSAYPSQTLQTTKAIDPSKWNPFRPEEGDSTEEWQEAERKARIGLSMLDGR
jgi:hypothetical protein